MPRLNVEVRIECSPEVVWAYFTKTQHWEKWWGAKFKSVEWQPGVSLELESGGSYIISSVKPMESVCFGVEYSAWSESNTFIFKSERKGKATLVQLEKDYTGVEFTDGGASRQKSSKDQLTMLKRIVEEDSGIIKVKDNQLDGVKAEQSKKWWQFWN